MIELHSITVNGRARPRLDSVSLELRSGAVHALIGPNGAGKSTLLSLLAGFLHPSAGSRAVGGGAVSGPLIGAVLDGDAMHPARTVREELGLRCLALGIGREAVPSTIVGCGLDGVARRRIGRLSLGMRTRLAIGSALLGDPDVLLLDEPLNGLDPNGIEWVRRIIRDASTRGALVVVSSHLLLELERIADTVTVMSRGRIVGHEERETDVTGGEVSVRADPDQRVRDALAAAGLPMRMDRDRYVVRGRAPDVARVLVAAGVELRELAPALGTFESMYSTLAEAEHLAAVPA